MAITAEHARAIQDLEILHGVCLSSVEGILDRCEITRLEAGQQLITAGERNRTMYMILAGRLSVHLADPDDDPIAHLGAGQTVGEISVIDDSPATAHVVACEFTRLLGVDEQAFWRLVAASHEFARNLLLLLAQRMRANNSQIAQAVELQRRFEHEAQVDGLTGLYNRRWLDEQLPRFERRHRYGGMPLSLLVIDIDFFKRFNDDHGHAAGDAVLVAVARAVRRNLRPTDFAARFGGEEFVVILPGTALEGARVAGERLRAAVGSTGVSRQDGEPLPPVTISVGVGELGDEAGSALLQRADAALYRAKQAGRDRVELS